MRNNEDAARATAVRVCDLYMIVIYNAPTLLGFRLPLGTAVYE